MRYTETSGIRIRGIAGAVSKQWVPTEAYLEILGEDVIASFKRSSGVKGRYLKQPGQTAGDLCYAAAKKIMQDKQMYSAEIGALVMVTQTGDYGDPATACVLQHRLGLSENCLAFDVNLGCSGYSYGLNVLSNLMRGSDMRYGLLLAGDTKGCEPIPGENAMGTPRGGGGKLEYFAAW